MFILLLISSVFPLRQAIYFDAPDETNDFRNSRGEKAYIGTTDTFFDGDRCNPIANEEDIDYFLRSSSSYVSYISMFRVKMSNRHGLAYGHLYMKMERIHLKLSRKDEIWEAGTGLITIAGGKLTGYRKMAETVVDLVVKRIGSEIIRTLRNRAFPVIGWRF